jgi:hypothetical protein
MIEQTKVGFFELYNVSSVKVILTSVWVPTTYILINASGLHSFNFYSSF